MPLDIIISDDCSSDNTFSIANKLVRSYLGRHQVKLIRNKVNLGITSHVNEVFKIARGDLVVVAAGDDISLPHRVESLVNKWLAEGKPSGLIHSQWTNIDENGVIYPPRSHLKQTDSPKTIQSYIKNGGNLVHGATAAYSKTLFVKYGRLPDESCVEDCILTFRALLEDGIFGVDDELIFYRVHSSNLSAPILFNEEEKWLRWLKSIRLVYQSNLNDHLSKENNSQLDMSIKRNLERKISALKKSERLIGSNVFAKTLFLFQFPEIRGIFNRTAFILRTFGFRNSKTYRYLSRLFNFFKFIRNKFSASLGSRSDNT
jgi:Glycosyltransferases, probably involved in cell wall biogenesis